MGRPGYEAHNTFVYSNLIPRRQAAHRGAADDGLGHGRQMRSSKLILGTLRIKNLGNQLFIQI